MQKPYYVIESTSAFSGERFIMFASGDKNEAKNYFTKAYMIYKVCEFSNKIRLIETTKDKVPSYKKVSLPEKLYFCISLGLDNKPQFEKNRMFGGLRLSNNHFRIKEYKLDKVSFVPLKDNEYNPYVKGWFKGNVPIEWDRSREYHLAKAEDKVKSCFSKIIPKWVLDSVDGKDERFPQGVMKI